ncbi:hypothetical protein LAZ67_12001892 [Cordylochernes scorpioides]|uniref:Reverse transcriptase domain-containing protein n=1 Tax=Cordylochernes scorpioides TaxID=51811 RepID=A0ABY6L696_9ARAC|nr:hypothetical protein LAZ67_12001892 [Cordylochernes scorpioides]
MDTETEIRRIKRLGFNLEKLEKENENNAADCFELDAILKKIENIKQQLEQAYEYFMGIKDADELLLQIEEVTDKYCRLEVKILRFTQHFHNDVNLPLSNNAVNKNYANLPKIELPIFDGKIENWISFRSHPIAISADITKVYRQILVHPEDTPYQRIIWTDESGQGLKEYELKTLTYRTSCAPFMAIRVLKQLAHDEQIRFPTAVAILKSEFYVDDLLTGCETVENGRKLIIELDQLLQAGGFKLKQWTSNKPTALDFKKQTNQLSMLMLTKLWAAKLTWDLPIPVGLQESWKALQNVLASLHQVQIPRWIRLHELSTYEIHGFSDASQRAYAAMVYIKIIHNSSIHDVYLLAAKTREATLKTTTTQRMELCASLVLAQLTRLVCTAMSLNINKVTLRTDSTIVLSWLASEHSRWKPYVYNRVNDIQDIIPCRWMHVKGEDNSADLASRRLSLDQLLDLELWWHGPPWLKTTSHPNNDSIPVINEQCLREQRIMTNLFVKRNISYSFITRYSSLNKLKRITGWIFRFFYNCRKPLKKKIPEHYHLKKLRPLSTKLFDVLNNRITT